MNTPLRTGTFLLLVALGSSCGAKNPGSTTLGRIPANHRADNSLCTQAAPAGTCSVNSGCVDGGSGGSCLTSPDPSRWHCLSDSDCADAGANGRCTSWLGPAGCSCTSDQCAGDSACPSGQTCACHGSPYMFGAGNGCVPGNCRIDADCGASAYCSPTPALPCNMGGRDMYCQGLGYYCHTPKDECLDDSDCQAVGQPGCLYDVSAGHWKCESYAQPA
jgi:hypothetical protein